MYSIGTLRYFDDEWKVRLDDDFVHEIRFKYGYIASGGAY